MSKENNNFILRLIICVLLVTAMTFAAMISAAVLPVLMETKSIIYPISAVSMAMLTAFAQYILERRNLYEKEEFVPRPIPEKTDFMRIFFRTIFAALIAIPAINLSCNFCVAPPLLVAFTEFSNPDSKTRKKPVKTVIIIASCDFAGAIFRYLFCINLALPLTISAVFSITFSVILMKFAKQFIPPAAALGILPLIISEKSLFVYPVEIALGSAFFMLCAFCFRNKRGT